MGSLILTFTSITSVMQFERNLIPVMSQGGKPTCVSPTYPNTTSTSNTQASKSSWLSSFASFSSHVDTSSSTASATSTSNSFFSSFTLNNNSSEGLGRDANVWMPQSL